MQFGSVLLFQTRGRQDATTGIKTSFYTHDSNVNAQVTHSLQLLSEDKSITQMNQESPGFRSALLLTCSSSRAGVASSEPVCPERRVADM